MTRRLSERPEDSSGSLVARITLGGCHGLTIWVRGLRYASDCSEEQRDSENCHDVSEAVSRDPFSADAKL